MIETEYKGHKIRWSDNEDQWVVSGWDKMQGPSLAKLKQRIDKELLEVRKAGAVRCLRVMTSLGSSTLEDATVVEYLGGNQVAAMLPVAFDRTGKLSRQHVNLSYLAHDTWEVRDAVERASALKRKAEELSRQADSIIKAIPRLTVADIPALVKAAQHG